MRFVLTAALLLALAGTGCQAEAPTSLTAPVRSTGTPVPFSPSTEVPDAPSKALALAGAQIASLLGPTLTAFSPLADGFQTARDKHPAPYRLLSGISGWDFRHGWYWHGENNEARTLRGQYLEEGDKTPGWDVTDDANYGPDFHAAFPRALARMRMDVDEALPMGGRYAASLMAALPSAGGHLEVFGSGTANLPGGIGQVGFEALNASFALGQPVDRGDLGLKLLFEGTTYQFTGRFNGHGLMGAGQLFKNAVAVGEVVQVDGRWVLSNAAGAHALP